MVGQAQSPAAPCAVSREASPGQCPFTGTSRSCHTGTSRVLACSVALIPYHVPAGLACDVCALPAPSSVMGTPQPNPGRGVSP